MSPDDVVKKINGLSKTNGIKLKAAKDNSNGSYSLEIEPIDGKYFHITPDINFYIDSVEVLLGISTPDGYTGRKLPLETFIAWMEYALELAKAVRETADPAADPATSPITFPFKVGDVIVQRNIPYNGTKYIVEEVLSPNKIKVKERPGEILPSYYFIKWWDLYKEERKKMPTW